MGPSALVERESLVRLESEELRVDVVATNGGRITSVASRLDGREWLIQGGGPLNVAYGTRFTDTDHCGWDEMFPSVDACTYPTDPFRGREVVDHGELWCSTWEVLDETATSLRQRVRSDRFSYTFERVLAVRGSTLRADYACVVDADVPVAPVLLWALHPQFSLRRGSRVLLSGQRDHLLDTSDAASVRHVGWLGDLVVERDVEPGGDRMFYAEPADDVREVRIVDPGGSSLRLSWDHGFAPYLGIWMDNGRYTTGHVVALEPTNGFFDELARAHRSGTVGTFPPGSRVTWWAEVCVDEGDER
ncbi:MAG: hypothetical protein WCA31_14005 [Acidimicrobiales bacterium]